MVQLSLIQTDCDKHIITLWYKPSENEKISNFALSPVHVLCYKGKINYLWERENWISKTQSELLSCGGDEELHFKQIATPQSWWKVIFPLWSEFITFWRFLSAICYHINRFFKPSALFAETKSVLIHISLSCLALELQTKPPIQSRWRKKTGNMISFPVKRNLYL